MRKLLILTLLIFSFLALVRSTFAQESGYDRVNNIAKYLNCPTCAGINLSDCRTLTCEQWRGQIGDLVAEGYSDQEVLDYFATRYGSQVLQEPPKSGTTLILWILPLVALLLGGGWLFYTMHNWTRRQPTTPGVASSVNVTKPRSDISDEDDDYLSQVEQDLGVE